MCRSPRWMYSKYVECAVATISFILWVVVAPARPIQLPIHVQMSLQTYIHWRTHTHTHRLQLARAKKSRAKSIVLIYTKVHYAMVWKFVYIHIYYIDSGQRAWRNVHFILFRNLNKHKKQRQWTLFESRFTRECKITYIEEEFEKNICLDYIWLACLCNLIDLILSELDKIGFIL